MRALVLLALLLSGCFFRLLAAPKIAADDLPAPEGLEQERAYYAVRCSSCHPLIDPRAIASQRDEIVTRYVDQKLLAKWEGEAIKAYLEAIARSGAAP